MTDNYLGRIADTGDHVPALPGCRDRMCVAQFAGAIGDCVRPVGHDGPHQGAHGYAWESDTRNDRDPFPVVGMAPTGEGRYAECPDHAGKRLAYRTHALTGSTYFVCPACESTGNAGDAWPVESALFARDVYLEHDESWRVVAGYLYVDTHERPDPDDRDTVDVCDCCLLVIANGDESGCRDYYGHDHPSCSIGRAVPGDASDTVTRWFRWDCAGCGQTMLPGADAHAVIVFPADHVDYPHEPGALYDCPACESMGTLDRD